MRDFTPAIPAAILLAAMFLDRLFGDPRFWWHPVRLLGNMVAWLEANWRAPLSRLLGERLAGVALASVVVLAWAEAVGVAVLACAALHPSLGAAAAAVCIYFTVSPHDLAAHARAVERALAAGDLVAARRAVGLMVGRDTAGLDAQGVTRAAVESVAENLVDGVSSAVFWAVAGAAFGAAAWSWLRNLPVPAPLAPGRVSMLAAGMAASAAALRAINTLDAIWGYRDERYGVFGCFCARLDDAAHYLPARLTVPLLAFAALLLGERAGASLRLARRDHGKHASPNSAWPEAAMAGALGMRLGGPVCYHGRRHDYPFLGEERESPVGAGHVARAVRLMLAAAWLAFLAAALAAAAVIAILPGC